jgi:DNA-binding transcriptional regulator LsrR (DeoR family)
MEEPPNTKPTEAKTDREARNAELRTKALAMASRGLSQRKIAESVGVSVFKVNRLLKS